MREAFGDIWSMAALSSKRVVCVTTNLQTDRNGHAVMGGGIAREARDKFSGLARAYGAALKCGERSTFYVGELLDAHGFMFRLVMFPTKDQWRFNSKPELIERSARDLVAEVDEWGWREVFLPRPGCGLGGLKWEDVKPMLEPIFDDRFVVVGFPQEAVA